MKRTVKFNSLAKNTLKTLRTNSPTILSCAAIFGLVTSVVMAVKDTPKALALIDNAKEEKGEELTKWETVKVAAPAYIPTIIASMSTATCILGSNILNKKQTNALSSACALINNSYRDYTDKVKETYGEEADQQIREAIIRDKMSPVEDPYISPGNGLEDIYHGDEKVLFYDEQSDRYFESTITAVQAAEYRFNRSFTLGGEIYLNDLYEFLGLPATDYGDLVGWSMEDGYTWVDFHHIKSQVDDMTCYIIMPVFPPRKLEFA